ncbi:hypothetical protein D7193_11245 [Micromonospora costi]|uniref:Uncharacterized protein n=1 Tax=Micromonospora costi TaxID=1530042 RepID=A0A3B0A795_9ACTN|nr:hypothetical protein D7193_11245 [Micromonospora costi]
MRTMIVCLPDGLSAQALVTAQLDRRLAGSGMSPRFWATPDLRWWQRGQLLGLQTGRPAYCAGGPVRLLDLAGMRHAAGVGAGIRYEVWRRVVHGTRPAIPWPTYLARHLVSPFRYPRERAEEDFHQQPRVNAMRMHNAVSYGAHRLPLEDLEVFQAGSVAYQHYCAANAVCGDALLTPDGRKLAPTSDALCHRVTYLEQATRYLDTVQPHQRLLAVAL